MASRRQTRTDRRIDSIAARVVLVLIVVLLLSGPAGAATQRELTLGEMVGLSDEIVIGRVVDSESHWQGELIVTVTRVDVDDELMGSTPGHLELTQLGGTAVHPRTGIEVTLTASTHVEMRPGDEVLLFVSRASSGIRQIVGAQQGRYLIRHDAQSGRRSVPVGPKRLETSRATGSVDLTPREITLSEMRERVRSEIARRRVGSGAGR